VRLHFVTPAAEEFWAAIDFYNAQRSGLGREFVEEVERSAELISTFPSAGVPGPANTRRIHLRRFPFALVYQTASDLLVVVAVEHQKREPNYWAERP
jgi:plasmid stabilization system protein ParE